MRTNYLTIFYILIISSLFIRCDNDKYFRIEKISKNYNHHVYTKICYVFLSYNYIFPCRKFNVNDYYEGLNQDNLDSGFCYNNEYLSHYQYLSLMFSSDTFLIHKTNGIDTLYIVPAYVEYQKINGSYTRTRELSDFTLKFNDQKIRVNAFSGDYIIHNIIPLRTYYLDKKYILADTSFKIEFAKAPITYKILNEKKK
jgi:hypothetical protein